MHIAYLQRAITLVLLASALLWAVLAWRLGAPEWAAGGLLLIVLVYMGALGLEFALVYLRHTGDTPPRPTVRQLLRAWWGEVTGAPLVFCWQQPFRTHRWPDFLPSAAAGRRGVVLVHGYVCNRAFWNAWMRRLRAMGVAHASVTLSPPFGSISDYAAVIDDAVRRVQLATGLPPVVVGHSMGGLAIRAWLASHRAYARAHRVVTIGSPHGGTWIAGAGTTRNAREMRLGSAWLSSLSSSEPPGCFERFVCCYSHCDNIVGPVLTAVLPGALNVHFEGVGHVHMAGEEGVFALVVDALRS